jgi:hypothetical protein
MDTSEVRQLSTCLRALKDRSDRSYEALARRIGTSGSTLHRYCAGTKVPSDFEVLRRFGQVCGLGPAEMRELHRLWAVADAARNQHEAPPEDTPAEETTAVRKAGDRRALSLALGAVVIVLAGGVVAWTASSGKTLPEPPSDSRLLLSPACPPVVSMGQHDACVTEVQTLLERMGAKITVDGDFGPQTLRRVTAFQVLANLQPRGVVDEATKNGLYEQKTSLETWTPEQVEKRVREVFPDVPDHAAAIARCQSFLDPLHVLPNTNGTRNWGVFQLSDALLNELGGSPRQALDPDWNIRMARRAWERKQDFSPWPNCDQAFRTASAAPTT